MTQCMHKLTYTLGKLAKIRDDVYLMRVAQWLATCAQKPKVPGSSPAASYVQR